MAGIKDALRSVCEAVFPLKRTPTYEKLLGRLQDLPESHPFLDPYYDAGKYCRLGLGETGGLVLSVKNMTTGRWIPKRLDRGTLLASCGFRFRA